MDLSGIIFAALAVGWAIYLIPKALQHGDEVSRARSVDTFSQRMRVIGRVAPLSASVDAPAPVSASSSAPVSASAPAAPTPAPRPITRAAAARAARKRRRVLGVLLALTAVVAGVAGFGYVPWISVAAPAGLIVVFLVIARMTVRRQAMARRATGLPVEVASPLSAPAQGPLETEETITVSRAVVEETVSQAPLADEGSLWDPLPVTLPTYVGKPAVRRTVRTIALTQTASSGHNAADSELVRKAEAAASEKAQQTAVEQTRKAAGA